jgi:hypothetical protein
LRLAANATGTYRTPRSKNTEMQFCEDLRSLTASGVLACLVHTFGKEGSIEQRLEREMITDGYALPIAELPNLAEASHST